MNPAPRAHRLRAFVSSTFVDLQKHRAAVIEQLRKAGIFVDPMEDWTADGDEPKEFSAARVEGCDLCVLLVAFRRGHVPDGETLSITQIEYQRACQLGIDLLPFVLDEDAAWPRKFDQLDKDPQIRVWRDELMARHGVGFFGTDPASIPFSSALSRWLDKLRMAGAATPVDQAAYLRKLYAQNRWIDIRGLQVGTGRVYRFPIRQLFIPLTVLGGAARDELAKKAPRDQLDPATSEGVASEPDPSLYGLQRNVQLSSLLGQRLLLIVGDPGMGKTTFLRRIVAELCEAFLGTAVAVDEAADGEIQQIVEIADQPEPAAPWWDTDQPPLPVLIRFAELHEHIQGARGLVGAPTVAGRAAWLPHFLAAAWSEACSGADEAFFRNVLQQGQAIVLLDGLDEAASDADRQRLVALLEHAVTTYDRCPFVVTSRPAAVQGRTLPAGFRTADIAPLEPEAVQVFLRRWCAAVYPDDRDQAEKHLGELLDAVRLRDEIRRMARNPVMLTALAVVHWNEKRLPEQRADLYESILTWLSRSRELRAGRPKPDTCIGLLQNLALAMHDHPDGRQVQVRRRWAAECIADGFRDEPDRTARIAAAESFLADEELDSGIVVARGDDLRFWHLTFQEYLAARALAACTDQQRRERLLATDKRFRPEWRETFLLLAGVLHRHGMERVDDMLRVVLDQIPADAPLADRARCAGLLGAAVRDLSPVKYRPNDARYERLLEQVLGIFDAQQSRSVPIQDAIAAADALGQAGDPRFARHDDPNLWVTIPAGKFHMGSQKTDENAPNHDPQADADESPVREVYLDAFRIARYPVTVDQYRLFVENDGYTEASYWDAGGFEAIQRAGRLERATAASQLARHRGQLVRGDGLLPLDRTPAAERSPMGARRPRHRRPLVSLGQPARRREPAELCG
jgi:hypothetical protein